MFTIDPKPPRARPSASAAAPLRNPRRRPRTASADALSPATSTTSASAAAAITVPPVKRRKRSALPALAHDQHSSDQPPSQTEAHTQARDDAHTQSRNDAQSQHQARSQAQAQSQRSADIQGTPSATLRRTASGSRAVSDSYSTSNGSHTGLAVRSRHGRKDRERLGDSLSGEGRVLTKNDHYTLTQEPNLPEKLQDILHRVPWHVQFAEQLGYAVAFTHTKAIIWRYGRRFDSVGSTELTRPISLNFQSPSTASPDPRDPLPQGALVHDAGSGELALLVVLPHGKTIYWEAAAKAATADVDRQIQQSLQGKIAGLYGSETVEKVTAAEPDGFVISTRAGRILHLTVRDGQGRPAVSSQLLQSSSATNKGLFSSIKGVLTGAAWRQGSPTVRMGSTRGKSSRICLSATAAGSLQVWDLARNASKTLEAEVDVRSPVLDALLDSSSETTSTSHEFQLFDFIVQTDGTSVQSDSTELLLLVGLGSRDRVQYTLVEALLRGSVLDVRQLHAITCWDHRPEEGTSWPAQQPRVLLPSPGHTALVLFDSLLIMLSLASVGQGPNAQLQQESHGSPTPFQDILHFTSGKSYHIVGATSEPSSRQDDLASSLVFVKNFGALRISLTHSSGEETRTAQRAAWCRSKLEQAIFFNGPSSLIDTRRGFEEVTWQDDELQRTALDVSDSILDGSSAYVSAVTPSMDQQLRSRAVALNDLMQLVRSGDLDHQGRWALLHAAEKVAAGRAIWKIHNDYLLASNTTCPPFLPELIDLMDSEYKHDNRPERGETDVVRHYLVHDLNRVDFIIFWAEHALATLFAHLGHDSRTQASFLSQADDIQVGALEAAFAFRENHAEAYGIGADVIEDGIYTGSYKDLPPFWTSPEETLEMSQKLALRAHSFALRHDGDPGEDEAETAVTMDQLTKIAEDFPRLVHAYCQVHEERCRYLRNQPNEADRKLGQAISANHLETRRQMFVSMAELELPDAGMKLAEQYGDMDALAELLTSANEILLERAADVTIPEEEQLALETQVRTYQSKMSAYFKTYGSRWARALYGHLLQQGQAGELLERTEPYVNDFLRSQPAYAPLNWIHEARQHEYQAAADDLLRAKEQETDAWNARVEVSLAKLCLQASREREPNKQSKDNARELETQLRVLDLIDRLNAYIHPAIQNALDSDAAVELALQSFCPYSFEGDLPYLRGGFALHLERLVRGETLAPDCLIDFVTSIRVPPAVNAPVDDADGWSNTRFAAAVELLRRALPSNDSVSMHTKIIWWRCLLADDWVKLNRTENKADATVSQALRRTTLVQTLHRCFLLGLFDADPPPTLKALLHRPIAPDEIRAAKTWGILEDDAVAGLTAELLQQFEAVRALAREARLEHWWPIAIETARKATLDGGLGISALKLSPSRQRFRALEGGSSSKAADKSPATPDQSQDAPSPIIDGSEVAALGNGNEQHANGSVKKHARKQHDGDSHDKGKGKGKGTMNGVAKSGTSQSKTGRRSTGKVPGGSDNDVEMADA